MNLLTSRSNHIDNTLIRVRNTVFGDGSLQIIAGPCTVESMPQLLSIAEAVKSSGATLLRGGAYKPRTSPYSFQGLGSVGLDYLLEAKRITGLPVVSEIMNFEDIPLFKDIDILQVGAKNMQNYPLLQALGHTDKPILLKRGFGNTIDELLYSAEYIMKYGNSQVILCERGIRTFEGATRYTFDINAIPLLKQMTHLPVVADPSHGTGVTSLVTPVSYGAIAAGADGLLVEVHNNPASALCDGDQALNLDQFANLVIGARNYEKIRDVNNFTL